MSATKPTQTTSLAAIRQRLAEHQGATYWRSLEEAADSPEFQKLLAAEFPEAAEEIRSPLGRRRFMKLMGASMALAGVTGCTRQPEEKIVPYVTQPESLIPGKPVYFASAQTLGGYATGVLVESHMGRPTKIEGNPLHPASLGAADIHTQAAILNLYDPDRAQTVTHLGRITPYSSFLEGMEPLLEALQESGGRGLRLLTRAITSPTEAAQIRKLLATLPEARWHQWEPLHHDEAHAATATLFGRPTDIRYNVAEAEVILSLDADFLTSGPGHVAYARAFAGRRRPNGDEPMNRLYVAESTPSSTGTLADHRQPLPAHQVDALTRALGRRLGLPLPPVKLNSVLTAWVDKVAADLQKHTGASLVIPGSGQPQAVHAVAHAINHHLGNLGTTVICTEPVLADASSQVDSLRTLVKDMAAGQVSTLLIVGGNPVHDAPGDVDFASAMDMVALRVQVSATFDETSALCHWHIPEAHELETWGDARAFDGTVSLIQPLIAPLYGGRALLDMLALLQGEQNRTAYDTLQAHWRGVWGEMGFQRRWDRALHDGIIPDSALPAVDVAPVPGWGRALGQPLGESGLEVIFRPDPNLHDGRFANNGWLHEVPRPLTKLTWDNAVLISPSTAERLGVGNEDVLELSHDETTVELPAWITPGHADESLTVHTGFGRKRPGRVGKDVGTDVYPLRRSHSGGFIVGAAARATGRRATLASTQEHHAMEGRHPVRSASLETYRHEPDFARHMGHDPEPSMSLFPDAFSYDGHAWGMVLDLNVCTGCNACVIACQAENSIAVVGKEQIRAGREMHWIRIDRYYEGGLDNPRTFHQPVMCQHCENAPCEVVCPVAATVHSDEGLNDMVYNRCVGTRYCSNNCPYKVRRFNFYLYSDWDTPSLKLQRNPDVTVRSRGVMEKCTYCVQRISSARVDARKDGHEIRDGDIVTACQQSCPTGAIVFGDINDKNSKVAAWRADERSYGLLTDLGTRPRTTYQAVVHNLNPEMEKA